MGKKWTYIYWAATGFFCIMMLFSATMYFTAEEAVKMFQHLGMPDYLRVELGIAKYLGVAALLLPMVPDRVKEWAYAGFGINLISAAVAHYGVGDSIDKIMPPVVVLGILIVSYVAREKK